MRLPALLVAAATLASACSSPAPAPASSQAPAATAAPPSAPAAPPADRKYLLERVDDAAVVQVYADGFSSLPLKEKTLVWHLYQAALAGRDIFIDQKHPSALEMRGVLEQIVANPTGVDAATLAEVQRYTKLFWLNNGPYNNLTARKFVLKSTPEAFAAAVKASASAGATFATRPGESVDQMLARL
jgi:dipeptidyl-peptidase III